MLSRGGRVDSRVTSPVEALFLGGTALHVACGTTAGDRDQQVEFLLERGADVTATLPCGLRPVDVARGASTRALFKAGAEPAARRGSAASLWDFNAGMLYAVCSYEWDEAERRLRAGAPQNTSDICGLTSLHFAALLGDEQLARTLITHGALSNCTAFDGRTPLHEAASNGHLDVCRLLLASGADPAAQTWLGFTPSRLAAMNGHTDIRDMLQDASSVVPAGSAAFDKQAPTARRPRRQKRATPAPPPSVEDIARADAAAAQLIAEEEAEAALAAAKERRRAKRAAARR